MSTTTDHYLGIDVHKTGAYIAVMDKVGEVRVANANLDEIAQKYEENQAALEAGSNHFTIYDELEQYVDVTLANPARNSERRPKLNIL